MRLWIGSSGSLPLALPLGAGLLIGGIFFWLVVDGSLWPVSPKTGIVVRFQSVATDEHFPGCFLFLAERVGQRFRGAGCGPAWFMLGRLIAVMLVNA